MIAATLFAGSAFAANTPYHNGTATVVEPTDDRNPLAEVVSGYDFRKSMIREMQDDEFSNPGMLTVEYGMEIWDMVDGTEGKSLADVWTECTGTDAEEAGALFPRYHEGAGKVLALEQQVNLLPRKLYGGGSLQMGKSRYAGHDSLYPLHGQRQTHCC